MSLDPEYQARLRLQSPAPSTDKFQYADRFIPSRSASNLHDSYELLSFDNEGSTTSSGKKQDDSALSTYNQVLKTELFDSTDGRIFKYKEACPPSMANSDLFTLSPLKQSTETLLSQRRTASRKISKMPFKILEAPMIEDDFYLNLVDWSCLNLVGVGLKSSLYLWNASSGQVSKLCDIGPQDYITSVSWIQRGTHVALGTSKGAVQIWDVGRAKKIRELGGHKSRVGALAWNDHTLCSGSRDRLILQRDVRSPSLYATKFVGHRQEVCGLKWSWDGTQLASGGNDNKLLVWEPQSTSPVVRFSDHKAAVKAIAWSPHQRGLLASGGGTADRTIRFWNTLTGTPLNSIDAGSQVCNLAWSKNVNELVSTHGYSQNQVVVWRYPSMRQVATLTGHTMRVLYLAVSPDGQTVVTGAGDETLRFWNLFPPPKATEEAGVFSNPFGGRGDIR